MVSRSALANAIRMLSMDAVQQANSGHPGMPMGMADMAVIVRSDSADVEFNMALFDGTKRFFSAGQGIVNFDRHLLFR